MITKRLTFNLLLESTKEKFPDKVLDIKSFSGKENIIKIVRFCIIRKKIGSEISPDAQ